MALKIKKGFSWAHRGVDVREYRAGDDLETEDQELIAVAKREGWVEESTCHPGSPENKADAPARTKRGKA